MKEQTVKFRMYHMTATVNTNLQFPDLGIEKSKEDPHLWQKEGQQDNTRWTVYCTISGRHQDGRGEVFFATGIAIQHPTDHYNEEQGRKLAFQDAVETLWNKEAFMEVDPEWYMEEWWSAYQKTRHGQKTPKCKKGDEAGEIFW